MRCDNCSHECTVFDFLTRRNLCDHLYLDALAQKQGELEFSMMGLSTDESRRDDLLIRAS